MTVFRLDNGYLQNITTSDGFLRAKVSIAKTGVFSYLHADGKIIKEAKLPEELFSQTTLDSLKGVPVTNEHPPVNDSNGLINQTNYSKYVRGSLGEIVVLDGDHIVTTETIYDAELIKQLKNGEKREVSIGFETDVEFTSGVYKGQRYDAVQRNIKINHLAHVKNGRAGESVKVHLDSVNTDYAIMQGEVNDMIVRIDGKDIEVSEEVYKEIESLRKKVLRKDDQSAVATAGVTEVKDTPPKKEEGEELRLANENLKMQVKTQQDLVDRLQSELNALKKTEPEKLDSLVSEKLNALDSARAVIQGFRGDGLSTKEIKLQVISKLLPFKADVKLDSVSDTEIDYRYDAALQLAREKQALNPVVQNERKLDSSQIEKLKHSRLTLNEEGK
jgi:uncharacterized protein